MSLDIEELYIIQNILDHTIVKKYIYSYIQKIYTHTHITLNVSTLKTEVYFLLILNAYFEETSGAHGVWECL